MKVKIISVGTKMPRWVQEGVREYEKRIAVDIGFSIVEVPLAKRSKTVNIEQCIQKEGEALLARVRRDDFLIALDVVGKQFSTEDLAVRLEGFRREGHDLSLLVGGPDGLSNECLARARESWSLSALTLPHPLVRVLLTEQLYRACSILKGHPYHRS